MASLATDVKRFYATADSLLADIAAIKGLDLRHQRLIAEVAMLRLFLALDIFIEAAALKLLTGVDYCDKTSPTLSRPRARSSEAAAKLVKMNRRPKVRYVKWTTLTDVQDNLALFMPQTEHFLTVRKNIDAVLEDMRHIRNHIAHANGSTGRKFRTVMQKIYPLNPRGVSPAKLLLSERRVLTGARRGMKAIEQYLRWSKTAVKTLSKS